MIELLEKNWFLVGALGTVLGFLMDRGYSYWKDAKERRQSYNRLLTSVVKLYASFIKHSNLYSENFFIDLPNEAIEYLCKHLDSFDKDLKNFKLEIEKESNLVPEISIQAFELFNLLDNLNLVNSIGQSMNTEGISNESEVLVMKRAYFFALDEVLNAYFKDTIIEIQKRTKLSKDLILILNSINSDEDKKEQNEIRIKIINLYFESLVRQRVIPVEALEGIKEELFKGS